MAYTFKQFEDAIEKNHSTRQDFIKHILTLASGMLAILAAFHTSGINTGYILKLYLSTLTLLAIGILSGCVTLYFDTVAAKSIFMQLKREMQQQLKAPPISSNPISYSPPKLFYICENICYLSLLLSVVSLAFYSALK
jgi:hypothetical protein